MAEARRPWRPALALLALAGSAALASSPEERAREILAASRFQRELPAPLELVPPDWLLLILRALSDVTSVLLVVGAAILLGLIAFLAVRAWEARRASRAPAPPAPGLGSDEGAAADLAEAERFAAVGRYDEAVHLLLLAAIDRVFSEASRRVSRAATSRELLRQVPDGSSVRAALAAIVALVEHSLFGERELTRADWEAGRAHWDALVRGA
jgi:hypothetical protein